MRRIIIEEPVSRIAVWSRRVAMFALAVAAIAAAIGHLPDVEPRATLSVFAAALVLAGVAMLMAVAGLATIWRLGRGGAGQAVAALLIGAGLLAYPLWLAVAALRLPPISDISTDLVEPPTFSRSARAQAARGGRTRPEPTAEMREAQRRFYPGIEPIVLDVEPEEAFKLVLKTAQAMRWRIVEETRPGGRSGVGHIAALDRTLFLGLPDDIAIRLRPLVGQTRVDIRSASRVGRHDLGKNAARIHAFSEELLTQAEAR